jgi:hypothetical protein
MRSADGTEFGNVVIENIADASVTYYNIARHLADPELGLKIEDVVGPLNEGNAIYAGTPHLLVMIAGCEGDCFSATWN